MGQSMKETVQNFAVSQALKYLDNNPQEAFPKILAWADQFDKDDLYQAFQYFCEIGYIKVDIEHAKDICSIDQVISGIVRNYHCKNDTQKLFHNITSKNL